jgi:membrane fusion protein, macrolide-specific efflux system
MNDTTSKPVRRRKASGARKAIIATVAVVVAGGGWYGWQKYKDKSGEEGQYLTDQVTRGDIEDLVTSTGTLQPRDYVDVGAQVSGQIEKINVEVGDMVKKGDVLATIDAETSQARMDQSEASLKSAKNSLETQKENLKKTERDFQRQKALYEQDATTKQAFMDAETAFENAKRQLRNSELDIERQEASMRIEKKNLAFTTIVAPIDGTVMSIAVKLGQTVNASQNVPNVMRIANLSTMTVQAEVSEADVAKLYVGMPVYFTTLSGNNRRWYGKLKRREPTPTVRQSVVLYNALFDVENDSGELMPQMTAQVFFVSAEAKDVLVVPMSALQQGQQIFRELAQKEKDKNATAKSGAAGGKPGAMPGPPGAAAATTTAGAAREGGPAVPGVGSAPASAPQGEGRRPGTEGNRAANAQGQGARGGQPGAGGNFNGPRPGGATGGPGGFNPENMTPEQREQFARMRAQGGGGFGGSRAGGQRPGGRGNFGAQGAEPAVAGGPRPAQRRTGMVMVQKADGTLEARRIAYGVTNRVHSEVIEGLTEGEVVVIGRKETEAAAAARPALPNQQFQQNNRGNQAFPAGGGGFQGGGGGGGGRGF